MIWPILFISSVAFSQIDLTAIKKLDEELPNYSDYKQADEEMDIQRTEGTFHPRPIIRFEKIKNSGTELGSLQKGTLIRKIQTNENYQTYKQMFVRFYRQPDENGFKYLVNHDGSVTFRVRSGYVESIKEDLVLYEPPSRFTPAPQIIRSEYDKKLSLPPEVTFYAGLVKGDFMVDLFNDSEASRGTSTQYGFHMFTNWALPIKAGGVLHYERTSYNLRDGGKIIYTAPSIGPQFKTKDFDWFSNPLRFQAQFRISPFAKASAETIHGPADIKFNSADFLASVEFPFKNRLGEFVLGFFLQNQWLNIKSQKSAVEVNATNRTNKTFGLSLAQVFE